ncbi:MAG TPA: cation diffusion facilitator family transporter [Thermoplasmata archaeon]|nr:cation diffusion facilitator family transporter [Thermoplasmata archaeon]
MSEDEPRPGHVHLHGEREAEGQVLRGLRLATALALVVLIVEAAGAYLSRSLSLTVDAVHNIPDMVAFSVSLAALGATAKGSSGRFTFGTHRFEVFAGLLNAALVLGTGAAFGFTAVLSLRSGATFAGPVDPVWLLAAAVPTLALRGVSLSILGRIPGRVRDLNLSGVVVHMASDLAITGALLATGVTLLVHPGWAWFDDFAAIAIALILGFESLPLFREGWDVLTERTPRRLSVEAVTNSARAVPGVTDVHDVHLWSVCSTLVCMTAYVGVEEMALRDAVDVIAKLREKMESEFGILHATFEIEAPARTPSLPPGTGGLRSALLV